MITQTETAICFLLLQKHVGQYTDPVLGYKMDIITQQIKEWSNCEKIMDGSKFLHNTDASFLVLVN